MCTSNAQCQAGFRCDTTSGQCVPSNGSGDPIKPPVAKPAKVKQTKEKGK